MADVTLQVDLEDCISCRACYDDATNGHIDWDDDNNVPVLTNPSMSEDLAEEVISTCPSDCYFL